MATPYFALYPTDFLADVGHLGNTELGVYWRLLLVYYRDGRPLPFDQDRLRRIAMTFSPEECRALESVVSEFFSLSTEPDGSRVWRHKRADIELARAAHAHEKKSAAARETNLKRWGRGSLAEPVAKRSLSDIAKRPVSDGEPEPELHKPPTSPSEKLSPARRGKSTPGLRLLLGAGIERQVAEDWVQIRKGKGLKVVTKTEVDGLLRQAEAAGLTPHEAVKSAVERGWGGFRASWLEREKLDKFGKPSAPAADAQESIKATQAALAAMKQTPEERAASEAARQRVMASIGKAVKVAR